jgi:hypothetical protein
MIDVRPKLLTILSLPFPCISQVPEDYPAGAKISTMFVLTPDNPPYNLIPPLEVYASTELTPLRIYVNGVSYL